jgi:hypothetical protein
MGRTRSDQVYWSFSCPVISFSGPSSFCPSRPPRPVVFLPMFHTMCCCCWFLGTSVSFRLHGPGFLVILHILDDLPSSCVSAPSLFDRGTPPVISLSCPVVTMPVSSSLTDTCRSAGCAPCVRCVRLAVLLVSISLGACSGDGRCHGCESRRGWVSSIGQPANIYRLECQCKKNNIILSEKHTYS